MGAAAGVLLNDTMLPLGSPADSGSANLAQQKINKRGYLAGAGLGMLMKLLFSDH
jgi:hypothetical protein